MARNALSQQEIIARNQGTMTAPLTFVRNSTEQIIRMFISGKGAPNVFFFSLPDGTVDFVLFIGRLGVDMEGNTVVLDSFVLPGKATGSNGASDSKLRFEAGYIQMNQVESATWRHLLPAFAERCRQWAHSDRCAFSGGTRLPA